MTKTCFPRLHSSLYNIELLGFNLVFFMHGEYFHAIFSYNIHIHFRTLYIYKIPMHEEENVYFIYIYIYIQNKIINATLLLLPLFFMS